MNLPLLALACLVAAGPLAAHPDHGAPPLAHAAIYLPEHEWDTVADVPALRPWETAGWRFAKRLQLRNPTAQERRQEPVEADLRFHADQVTEASREVRVVRASDAGVTEVVSQLGRIGPEGDAVQARLLFLADVDAQAEATYWVLYGNPAAPAPAYATDLTATGEGHALEVDNAHYRAVLAASNGNLKSLYPKHGSAAFVGDGPPMLGGHGVEGTIHWGPDWSDERVGRYRLTSWDGPSLFDVEVEAGPVCVRVRRWGHPILSLGPQVGRPHKVLATVTYTFFAGQPYLLMESRLEVLEDVRFRDCRNDEWVVGDGLPEAAWMDAGGTIGFGAKGWSGQDPRWLTFFDRATGQGFASLHLDQGTSNPSVEGPSVVAIQDDRLWVRYPLRDVAMHAGEAVWERNAYLLHTVDAADDAADSGFADLLGHYQRLTRPLEPVRVAPAPKAVTHANALDALRATNEFELYVEGNPWGPRQLSFVDLGLVRQVAVDGADVTVDLVMPYAGRDTWFGWFARECETQLRERLRDVGRVEVRQVRAPAWSPEQMNARARRVIGPAD